MSCMLKNSLSAHSVRNLNLKTSVYSRMPRGELLAEDLKATGAPKRGYEFDYNDLYLDRKDRSVDVNILCW